MQFGEILVVGFALVLGEQVIVERPVDGHGVILVAGVIAAAVEWEGPEPPNSCQISRAGRELSTRAAVSSRRPFPGTRCSSAFR